MGGRRRGRPRKNPVVAPRPAIAAVTVALVPATNDVGEIDLLNTDDADVAGAAVAATTTANAGTNVANGAINNNASGDNDDIDELRHPDDEELDKDLEEAFLVLEAFARPKNTSLAFNPKESEHYQFCDHVYSASRLKHNITPEKVYRFMVYTALRSKRNIKTVKNGKGKMVRKRREKGVQFDAAECDSLMKKHRELKAVGGGFPVPLHGMQHQCFNAYKTAIKGIHEKQVEKGCSGLSWDLIWTTKCKKVQKHVKTRKAVVKKLNCEEKVNHEFAGHQTVERFDEIEEELWRDCISASGHRSMVTMLRHRCCALYQTSGILRSESLHRAEISDFLSLKPPKQETDIHPLSLMVNQMANGKNNCGRVLYGRTTRHKEVKKCAFGGTSFYLQHRFYVTNEFSDMSAEDWCDNKVWFDIKFLIDTQTDDNTREMANDSCGTHIKSILKRLNIVCNKLLHLGRNIGARLLELLEEEYEEIRRMGQWSPTVQDEHYSTKIPIAPIRKLAGYTGDKQHYNPRTQVIPSRELCEMTPIGKWCYKALEDGVELGNQTDSTNPTACAVLKFLAELNMVFLQDSAAMMHEGRWHPMFEEFEVFRTEQWQKFKTEMEATLSSQTNPHDKDIDKCFKGLKQWQNAAQADIRTVDKKVETNHKELKQMIKEGFEETDEKLELKEDIDMVTGVDFAEALEELAGRFRSGERPCKRPRLLAESTSEDTGDDGSPAQPEQQRYVDVSCEEQQRSNEPVRQVLTGVHDRQVNNNSVPLPPSKDPVHTSFGMKPNHVSLCDMWDEWHGTGEWLDKYDDREWFGIQGREDHFGSVNKNNASKWRTHLNSQQFSRTKRLVEAIKNCAEGSGINAREASEELNYLWIEAQMKLSIAVDLFQTMDAMHKGKPRGRKRKNAEQ